MKSAIKKTIYFVTHPYEGINDIGRYINYAPRRRKAAEKLREILSVRENIHMGIKQCEGSLKQIEYRSNRYNYPPHLKKLTECIADALRSSIEEATMVEEALKKQTNKCSEEIDFYDSMLADYKPKV